MLTTETCKYVKGGVRLAAFIAGKFTPNTILDAGDLLGIANLGLCEAAARYNPHFGAKFSTFATHYIRGRIHEARRTIDPLKREMRKSISDSDLRRLPAKSLNSPLRSALIEDDTLTLEDALIDPDNPYTGLCERLDLNRALTRLPERERTVIYEYIWGEKAFREIAPDMHVSEARVNQLYHQGLKRLRNYLSEEYVNE